MAFLFSSEIAARKMTMKKEILESLSSDWTDYESLVPLKVLIKKLARPSEFWPEKIQRAVPSIELAADGPVVASVFVFGTEYIGEVRLRTTNDEFDFILKNTIGHYRVELGAHRVVRNAAAIESAKNKQEEPPRPDVVTYETATITLLHNVQRAASILSYFGDRRNEWMHHVKAVLPVTVLKDASNTR